MISNMGDKNSFDWQSRTQDPNCASVKEDFFKFLLSRRQVVDTRTSDYLEFFENHCRGKRVLDIGICEHTEEYIRSKNWKHRRLRDVASYILGIDIIESLIKELGREGYNVRCVDALSDIDLGERFDVVVCGDVIEHVDNPVKLLQFARRHLAPGGRVLVSTPNAFYWYFIRQVFIKGTFVTNFDHTCWVTPSIAVELGRRAGLGLRQYYVFDGCRSLLKRLVKRFLSPELTSGQYLFEFIATED